MSTSLDTQTVSIPIQSLGWIVLHILSRAASNMTSPWRQEAGQDLAQVSTSLGHRVGRGTREDGAAALHLRCGLDVGVGIATKTITKT